MFPCLAAPSDAIALEVGEVSLTQRELASACARHLEVLDARGFAPGDRIGVWTQPAMATAVAFVAQAAGGYVSVPLDPKLGERELAHVWGDAKPRASVAADVGAVAGRTDGEIIEAKIETAPRALRIREVSGVPALVLYTSGTTGAPKGAILTDRNIAANLDMLARAWDWTERDTVVHALPLFHVHGLVLGLFGSIRRGGALRWVPKFTPEDIAAALVRDEQTVLSGTQTVLSSGRQTVLSRDDERDRQTILSSGRQTVLFAVPTMYHRLGEAASASPVIAAALSRPRLLVSGSAPLSTREHAALTRITGKRPIERYGLTETLINCSTRHDSERRAGFVGPPLDGVELRLVDDTRATITAAGEPGEICVRGPHVFAGYLDRPDATRAVLDDDGWFYTGDVAIRADDGQLQIIGRRSTDIIKCGGFKVGAGEVEAALLEHPAVSAAAVIGAPDDDLGEKIVAFVVLRTHPASGDAGHDVQPTELADFVARSLSPHKRPREIRLVEDLPRNAMGKVQKTVLRQLLHGR